MQTYLFSCPAHGREVIWDYEAIVSVERINEGLIERLTCALQTPLETLEFWEY
jgi:hypothetical protein